jgi:hypothetical protein
METKTSANAINAKGLFMMSLPCPDYLNRVVRQAGLEKNKD